MIKQILEITAASLLAVLLAAFIRVFFFDTYIVTNRSMEPTFYEGDEILLIKKNFVFNRIKSFDVIVFRINDNNLVKRVIGTDGDKIEIAGGTLYLNDEPVEHKYYIFSEEDDMSVVVGKNEYFVLGDNVSVSNDSREFGLINRDEVIGQVILIFSPKDRFRLFRN